MGGYKESFNPSVHAHSSQRDAEPCWSPGEKEKSVITILPLLSVLVFCSLWDVLHSFLFFFKISHEDITYLDARVFLAASLNFAPVARASFAPAWSRPWYILFSVCRAMSYMLETQDEDAQELSDEKESVMPIVTAQHDNYKTESVMGKESLLSPGAWEGETCGLPALGRWTHGWGKDVRGVSGNDKSLHRSEPQFSSSVQWREW